MLENTSSSTALTDEVWSSCIELLRGQLDSQVFSAYVEPIRLVGIRPEENELILSAPNSFLTHYIDRNLKSRIAQALSIGFGIQSPRVTVITEEKKSVDEDRPAPSQPYVVVKKVRSSAPAADKRGDGASTSSAGLGYSLNPKYTFANFVVGNSNQFGHAAALRVAESPGQSYNPLFVYGGVGLGKTHLLHAIGNAVLQRNPAATVVYMSSETFTNELILALRHAKMDEFKRRLRNVEVLLIDDIQFMRGKERTQEEFFHTFNALYSLKHQIVITSDKLPSDMPGLEERLQTRFAWGLTADLQAPDFETRVAILKRKACLDGLSIPEDVIHLISEKISSNVRELEGALTRLGAMSSFQGVEITLEMANSALRPLLQPRTVSLSVDDIKRAVAQHFGIKVSEMVSKRRTKNLSFPRHVAMYLCRKHTTASYPEIGGHFGGRDHSSVIHAANVVGTKMKQGTDTSSIVEEIERQLLGQ